MQYRPRNGRAIAHLTVGTVLTGVAITLSASSVLGVWLAGQLLWATAFLFWFAALHEAGHKTLFRAPGLNSLVGWAAGLLTLIPLSSWRPIHAQHHRWTGWQDLDPTTKPLAPRPRSRLERWTLNCCWALWIPLIAVLYRWTYWNPVGLWRACPERRWRVLGGLGVSLLAYLALATLIGLGELVRSVGLGLYLALVLEDLLILSQHTHIPMKLSGAGPVVPIPPLAQGVFTRSLVFPSWFARWILLNFDAHELHHMHPSVPGYDLHRLDQATTNRVAWWRWLLRAKSVRAEVLLFQNRDQTGLPL